MTAKHTKGPWSVDDMDAPFVVNEGAEPGYGICSLLADHKSDEELFANAHLIAAAPELLEALEAEQEWRDREEQGALDPEWDYETMVAQPRRAALAKARGE